MGTRELIALALVACTGPQPTVDSASLVPGPPGHQRVAIELRNSGGGHGQVELEITLRGSAKPITFERKVELEAHASLQLFVDVEAPPDTYSVTVEAVYPN